MHMTSVIWFRAGVRKGGGLLRFILLLAASDAAAAGGDSPAAALAHPRMNELLSFMCTAVYTLLLPCRILPVISGVQK